jgi:hypothetical protein
MNSEFRARLAQVALVNTPTNVRVIQIRKELSGMADCRPDSAQFGLMSVPRPVTRKSLYLFLHECAHFALHADGKRRKRYIEEMECEKWAHARMREAGIAVPRAMTRRAKEYVRYKMRQALRRGATKFDAAALKYTGSRQIGKGPKQFQPVLPSEWKARQKCNPYE